MQQQLAKTIRREDVDEHLLILNTIATDLTNDVNDIIDFMTYTKNDAINSLVTNRNRSNRITRNDYLINKRITFPF